MLRGMDYADILTPKIQLIVIYLTVQCILTYPNPLGKKKMFYSYKYKIQISETHKKCNI